MMVDRKIEISSIFSDFEMFLFLGSCFSKLTLTARNADQCRSINWQFPSPHSIHWPHFSATAKQPIRLQEISGILATNFHTLNIPGTTNYGLVTNFWGKFPLAAPPPPQTARGKLAKSLLLDSHSSSSGGRQEKGIRDKILFVGWFQSIQRIVTWNQCIKSRIWSLVALP